MRVAAALSTVLALAACSKDLPAAQKRAALRVVDGTKFELVPEAGQHPYCLAYTVTPKGVIRLLTMSEDNVSLECPAGTPIGAHAFRAPAGEPSVRVLVLFTSEKVNATTVSQQLLDAKKADAITAMDLRLPGQATLETFDFTTATVTP